MSRRQTIVLSIKGARVTVRLVKAYMESRLLPGEREIFIALLTQYSRALEKCGDDVKQPSSVESTESTEEVDEL